MAATGEDKLALVGDGAPGSSSLGAAAPAGAGIDHAGT